MEENIGGVVVAILGLVVLVALLGGAVKTFRRNWVAALILLIFLTPIWAIWAFVELFTGDIKKTEQLPTSNNQSINLTLVNEADGTTRRLKTINQADELDAIEVQSVDSGTDLSETNANVLSPEMKDCPYCAEQIKRNAVVCRYCNRDL